VIIYSDLLNAVLILCEITMIVAIVLVCICVVFWLSVIFFGFSRQIPG
jgi:hypothetical protein